MALDWRIGIISWVCAFVVATGGSAQAPAPGHPSPAPRPPAPVSGPPSPGLPITGFWSSWGRPLSQCLREHQARRGRACRGRLSVTIKKEMRRLVVCCDGEPVKGYFIGLGPAPRGAKERRGDMRTPEGTYYICNRVPRSAFYLSLRIAYPNEADAARGLREGLIDKAAYRRILSALRRRAKPPQNTALGGDICIHGGGMGQVQGEGEARTVQVSDWTWGCVAMRNQDIRELHSRLPIGTPVTIVP